MVVAGAVEPDPFGRVMSYAATHSATVRTYDLGGPGAAAVLTHDEVARTRVIRSRISMAEADWFVVRSGHCNALWQSVAIGARLADADPGISGELYDHAFALFEHFAKPPQSGVSLGKISKVLHLKRPHLFPILDSVLRHAYRSHAKEAALRLRRQRPRLRAAYWAAIRDDLLSRVNVAGLVILRRRLAEHDAMKEVAQLSDLRLLDMVTWRSTRRTGPAS